MTASLDLRGQNVVEKRNILNEMRAVGWNTQELRFFAIYLSKINARNPETRLVRFKLSEFERIMDKERVQAKDLKPTTDSLLQKILHVPLDGGKRGYDSFQLFKRCRVEKSKEDNIWYVDIDAHDEALPFMFDFKALYVSYKVINVLRLRGSNQIRMYEVLKQHENNKNGIFEVSLPVLRDMLGVEPEQYPRWERFRTKVLDVCQKAIEELTDIKYTYEPVKKGKGGKTSPVTAVKFSIKKNDKPEQFSFEDYIEESDDEESNEALAYFAEACDNEFSGEKLKLLYGLCNDIVPYKMGGNYEADRLAYMRRKYNELNYRAGTEKGVEHRFGYLKSLLEADLRKKNEDD